MSAELAGLEHEVAALSRQQPFAVHWQIRALNHRATPAGVGQDPGIIGQGAETQVASFSTRKVSLLLACLALVHRGELDLQQRLSVRQSLKDGVQAGIMKNLAAGVALSVEDHLRQMMITSDNICTQLIFEAIAQATGDSLQWVNDYGAWVGLRSTVHREVFPRSGELEWHHSIEQMTVTSPADQAHLLALLGQGTTDDDAAARLHLSSALCRFAVDLMRQIYTPLLGAELLSAETPTLGFAEKNGRGLRSLSQVGLATAADNAPVAAVAVYAENLPTELPDGTPGRLAAYQFFAEVGRAVQRWHTSPTNQPDDDPELLPQTARASIPPGNEARSASWIINQGRIHQLDQSSQPHALAGIGKLFAALALAERAVSDPDLLQRPVTISDSHRTHACLGPLRTHTGDMRLTLGDAAALVVSTSDAAAARAIREALESHKVDVVAEAQDLLARLGQRQGQLRDTAITGWEDPEQASGDLLVGQTTPDDVVLLLTELAAAGGLTGGQPSNRPAAGISADAARQVLSWMAEVFEPAGLTYALPGYGPKKVPQWSVSGLALRSPSSAGWTSVMITRAAGPGPHRGGIVCAAAHLPSISCQKSVNARRVAQTFGAIGLAAYQSTPLGAFRSVE